MDQEGGGLTMDLQAYKVMQNATLYRGSHACPQCGIVMNPVQAMYSLGICSSCKSDRDAKRVKGKMV